jgi:hypothetical protein
MRTLFEALKPRESVFDILRTDTVWNLSDLNEIDVTAFFEENYVTEAMRTLLPEAFKRLEQRHDSGSGIFHLSQSMGGGKTHSLVALGLLAKHQAVRPKVLKECGYEGGPLGKVRVVAFSGGAETTPNGLWGFIAEKLGVADKFKDCYAPLRNPSEKEWETALAGEPTLILLDEMPIYFSSCKAIETGKTSLDVLTALALASLVNAIAGNKLPNVCLVITDLAGTAWKSGGAGLESLADAEKQTSRQAITLSPVNLASDELYHIMRKRLFKELPSESEVSLVADGYIKALETAQHMGLVADVPGNYRSRVIDAYPFHPSIRDLYARVKENDGFQQTRALIRIMRLMVRRLWDTNACKERYLIGAHDYDLLDQAMKTEVAQINATFEGAVAKDVQDAGGSATAQQIDGTSGRDAQDVAKLLLLSSLSTAVNPTLGLHRNDIGEYLTEPGRDLTRLREVIDEFQQNAWYVHALPGSKLVFRNTQNIVAMIEDFVKNTTIDMREQEVRKRLATLFAPSTKDVYDEVLPLVSLDQVVLETEKVKLVIYKPTPESKAAVEEFFNQQTYKNRVCFLTAEAEPYLTALERAAYLSSIERVMGEPAFSGLNPSDPQKKQADDLKSTYQTRFFQALSVGFCKLSYPWSKGLFEVEIEGSVEVKDSAPVGYRGEAAIKRKLVEMAKFLEDSSPDKLLPKLDRIWPETQKSAEWNELKRLAATNIGYVWHHPQSLEFLKTEMIKRDAWRTSGTGWVERGPFAKDPTRVEIDRLSFDKDSGKAVIRVRPVPNSATVYHNTQKEADVTATKLTTFEFETADLWHSFLAVDSTGQHPQGVATTWTLAPIVKYALPMIDGKRHVKLEGLPTGTIKYTDDGSSLETSGKTYTGPFAPPAGALIQARAEGKEVKGESIAFNMPAADDDVVIDPKKPADWDRPDGFSSDSTQETYRFLELAKKFQAKLSGMVRLTAAKGGKTAELNTIGGAFFSDDYTSAIDELRKFISDASVTLTVDSLHFPSGRDLEDFAAELPMAIGENEVHQRG